MNNLPCEIQDIIYKFKHHFEFRIVSNQLMEKWDNGCHEHLVIVDHPDDIY